MIIAKLFNNFFIETNNLIDCSLVIVLHAALSWFSYSSSDVKQVKCKLTVCVRIRSQLTKISDVKQAVISN